ncbi:hypothetical protein FRC98_01600 [Lujinxingia vulgaris]|uniref:Uncharacterized protein n=1 Tax=Lujinxingia vulgaris TaxID=2600176 RepID=A0A5C6XGX9_9DELT|nr:hypothetical protein [Lujinxingia vulgaris]TXD39124.1 hypothetical protein FRC98_01600 [Lujinxingia vulgaris]
MAEQSRKVEARPPTGMDELGQNFSRLVRLGWGTVLVPWLAIAAVDFVFVAVSAALIWGQQAGDPLPAGGMQAILLQSISALEIAVVLTLRVLLFRVLRDLAMLGPSSVMSLRDVVRGMLARLGPTFLVNILVGAIVSVGLVLCVLPGLVAIYFLAFASYLVAVGQSGVLEALTRSATMARRHVAILLTGFAVAAVFAGVMGCSLGASAAVIQGSAGVAGGLLVGWVMNTVLGYLAWLWWGAVYITAEQRDQAWRIRKSAVSVSEPPVGAEPGDAPEDVPPPQV